MKWLKRAKKNKALASMTDICQTQRPYYQENILPEVALPNYFIQRHFYFRFWAIAEVFQRLVVSDSTYRCFPYDDDLLGSDKQGTPQMGS